MQNRVHRFGRSAYRKEHQKTGDRSCFSESQDNCDRSFGFGRLRNDKFNRINNQRRFSNGDRSRSCSKNQDFSKSSSKRWKGYRFNRQNRNNNFNNCSQSLRNRGGW